MKYKLILATGKYLGICLDELEEEVNEDCKLGWKPQGGVSVTETRNANSSSYYTATQAMIKEDNYSSM